MLRDFKYSENQETRAAAGVGVLLQSRSIQSRRAAREYLEHWRGACRNDTRCSFRPPGWDRVSVLRLILLFSTGLPEVTALGTVARCVHAIANPSTQHTSELQSLRHLVCRLLL